MRYSWPETIALFCLFVLAIGMFAMGVLFNMANLFGPWVGAAIVAYVHIALKAVLPFWLILRAIDWALAGPARRRLNAAQGE